jgi:membrane protein DedA with SNARE-associated domain
MAFLETGAFVGLLVPGETVVVVGGVAASHGDVSLTAMALVAWSGAWIGDATSFHLGRRYGPAVIAPVARRLRISEPRLAALEASLSRHGGRTVLVGRFMGFIRALAPFMAGASGMRYRDLAPWSLAGSGLWAFAFTFVGFQFAGAVESASRRTSLVRAAIAAVLAVFLVVRQRRSRPTTHHHPKGPVMQLWTIRPAQASDADALRRLAALDSQPAIDGPSLIAEVDHQPWAAIELRSRRVVADPFTPSAAIAAALQLAA